MSVLSQPTDFNDLLAPRSTSSGSYANTEKAETLERGGNYQQNSRKIKKPQYKPSFITIPRPKPVISGKS